MNVLGQTRFIERLQFFNGQRLFATDLQGLEAFNREMRWLHNRSLHQPGIGAGFAVKGAKGDREVRIEPGYAIDALGREIVLTDSVVEPIPPVASDADGRPVVYYLTVSYPTDDLLERAESRAGICVPPGAVRLRERPVFCWIRLEFDAEKGHYIVLPPYAREILDGYRIVLGQATVEDCQLREPFCVTQRRSARPPKLPRFKCGEAPVARHTLETLYKQVGNDGAGSTRVCVDTSCGGICSSPCYVVRATLPKALQFFWATIGSIAPRTDGFDADLVIGPILALGAKSPIALDPNDPVRIHWLAIET